MIVRNFDSWSMVVVPVKKMQKASVIAPKVGEKRDVIFLRESLMALYLKRREMRLILTVGVHTAWRST